MRPPFSAFSEQLSLSRVFLWLGLFIQIFFPTPLFLLFFLLDVSFFFIPLESSFTSQCGPFSNSPVIELSRCVGMSCSEDVAFPLETSNQNFKDCHFLRESLSNPEELCVSGKASSPKPEPPTLPLEGFQVEGLTPRKLVKVQSVLESLRIRIVRDNGKGAEVESKSTLSADKVYFRRKRKNDSGTRRED